VSPTAPPPIRERRVPAGSRPSGRSSGRNAPPANAREQRGWEKPVRRTGYRLGSSGRRLRLAAAIMAALFLLLAGRLIQLQGFQSHSYAAMAEEQRTRRVAQEAIRGEILDSSGKVLAVDVAADDIYVQPPKIKDAVVAANKLSKVLKLPVPGILAKLIDLKTNFRYLAYDVDPDVGDAVVKLNLPGIGAEPQRKRLYPAGVLAANVLGTVGREGHGLAGLESAYNTSLAGKNGTLVVEEDPQGRTIPSGTHHEKDAVAGQGLQLTLNRDIQYFTEQTLAATVKSTHSIKGAAIVLNPKTGEIYAMAQSPTFDPNQPMKASAEDLINQDVAWTFEPGSVNKLITVSAAVNRGIVNPLTEIDIPPSGYDPATGKDVGIPVDDYVIHDAEDHGFEKATVAGVLAKSSNMGTLLISRKLPSSKSLEDELRSFGLGSLTGINLPGESEGLLAKSEDWLPTQAANIPFGQSMSVTPLQIAMAYATIANGGVHVTPKIIEGSIDGKGKLVPADPGPTRRVVTAATAKTMTSMLEQVTTSNGTAVGAAIPGYRVAGKTGTANRVDPITHKYSGYVASFVGYAPADKPSLVVLVSLDNPQGDIFGGTTAAPAFKQIMQFALTSLRIPPTGTTPTAIPLDIP
jgi:cell division protein FtsI (penicillin-binding protein 3)